MKKTNTIKILVLAISLALLLCGIIGVTVSAQNDDASAPATASSDVALEVYMKNVSFQNSPQLVFAVAYENCDSSSITLDVWYGEKNGEAQSVTSFGNVTIGGKVYPAFAVNPINPKDLDTVVYAQAKSGDVTSEVERYSILEYAWSGVMTAKTDAEATDYYNIIDYSASVQKFLGSKFDGTPVANYFYVKAEGVALDESGYDSGIFTAPVTFTLGESELGWSVTTYVDGVKTTETKAGGSEITASASTICTRFEVPEPILPQDVNASPLDFSKITIGSTGNGGADTSSMVGSSLATTKKGVTTTTDNDDNEIQAYYFDTDANQAEAFRVQSNGDDLKPDKLAGANAFIFESDLRFDFVDASNSTFKILLGSYANTSGNHPKTAYSYAYYLMLRLDATTQTIQMLDSGVGGNGNWLMTDIKSGEWFKLRIEYYSISSEEMLALTFINNELVYVSNRYNRENSYGDNAWPVYSDSFKEPYRGKEIDGVSAAFIEALAATDATVYMNNTFVRRTTLTVPTISQDEYTSYYSEN